VSVVRDSRDYVKNFVEECHSAAVKQKHQRTILQSINVTIVFLHFFALEAIIIPFLFVKGAR